MFASKKQDKTMSKKHKTIVVKVKFVPALGRSVFYDGYLLACDEGDKTKGLIYLPPIEKECLLACIVVARKKGKYWYFEGDKQIDIYVDTCGNELYKFLKTFLPVK